MTRDRDSTLLPPPPESDEELPRIDESDHQVPAWMTEPAIPEQSAATWRPPARNS